MVVAAAAIFFIALIVATYITMRVSDLVIDSRVGAFDRALGFLFGAARGILLLVIALLSSTGSCSRHRDGSPTPNPNRCWRTLASG